MDGLRGTGLVVAVVGGVCGLGLALIVMANLAGGSIYDMGGSHWLIRRVAAGCYVIAIGLMAFSGWQVARGRGFGDVMPRLLSSAGLMLALGAGLETFGVTLLARLLDLGDFRALAYFDTTYVVLGMVGLLLWLLGRLMRRAIGMARELEEFL